MARVESKSNASKYVSVKDLHPILESILKIGLHIQLSVMDLPPLFESILKPPLHMFQCVAPSCFNAEAKVRTENRN